MIRDADAADAPAIAAIWNPLIAGGTATFSTRERTVPETAALIADRRTEGHPFLVWDDGSVRGFASYKQFRAAEGYARSMEHTVHCAPDAQGRGVGRALVTALEDRARAAGHRLMIGGITASNAASVAFHARLGYEQWGRIPAAGWKFGAFHDLILMGKDLMAKDLRA